MIRWKSVVYFRYLKSLRRVHVEPPDICVRENLRGIFMSLHLQKKLRDLKREIVILADTFHVIRHKS